MTMLTEVYMPWGMFWELQGMRRGGSVYAGRWGQGDLSMGKVLAQLKVRSPWGRWKLYLYWGCVWRSISLYNLWGRSHSCWRFQIVMALLSLILILLRYIDWPWKQNSETLPLPRESIKLMLSFAATTLDGATLVRYGGLVDSEKRRST